MSVGTSRVCGREREKEREREEREKETIAMKYWERRVCKRRKKRKKNVKREKRREKRKKRKKNVKREKRERNVRRGRDDCGRFERGISGLAIGLPYISRTLVDRHVRSSWMCSWGGEWSGEGEEQCSDSSRLSAHPHAE